MKVTAKILLSLIIVAAGVAVIYLAARVGLLFLYIAPNPRHPPLDLLGEAVGWAVVGAGAGAISAVIGETVTMLAEGNIFIRNKGLIIGSAIGIVIAIFLGMNFAVLQMDSVDGQAMTSVNLAIIAGTTAGVLGSIAGIVMGVTVRRLIVALSQ
ncbi:MAG TPA: hypothetical protein VFA32_16345 [Dehalococcoidia bacterium]|jgi:hypothetical protein|nr:hypothetical protein [Dehalococcoidia bacterium]